MKTEYIALCKTISSLLIMQEVMYVLFKTVTKLL